MSPTLGSLMHVSLNRTHHAQAPGLVVPSDVHEVTPVHRQQGAAGGDVGGHLCVHVCMFAMDRPMDGERGNMHSINLSVCVWAHAPSVDEFAIQSVKVLTYAPPPRARRGRCGGRGGRGPNLLIFRTFPPSPETKCLIRFEDGDVVSVMGTDNPSVTRPAHAKSLQEAITSWYSNLLSSSPFSFSPSFNEPAGVPPKSKADMRFLAGCACAT